MAGRYNFELDIDTENSLSIILRMIKKGTKILEVGSANGRMTGYLKEKLGCTVDIIEIDEEAGKQAGEYSRISCIGKKDGDVEERFWEEKLGGEQYDYIVFADVLEHLHNPGKVLVRAKKFLKDEGSIILSVPNLAHNAVILNLLDNNFEYREVGLLDSTHIHFFTYKSLKNMLRNCGYICEFETATYCRAEATELGASFESIPLDFRKFIRNRKFGNIYQFIFKIAKEESLCGKEFSIDKNYDMVSSYLFKCYYLLEGMGEYSEEYCKSIYFIPGRNCFTVEIQSGLKITGLRIDPMECNCILRDFHIYDLLNGREAVNIKSFNGIVAGIGYIFDTADPNIEIEVPSNHGAIALEVCFEVGRFEGEDITVIAKAICEERVPFTEYRAETENAKERYEIEINSLRSMCEAIEKERQTVISEMEKCKEDLDTQKKAFDLQKSELDKTRAEYEERLADIEREHIFGINTLEERINELQGDCTEIRNQSEGYRRQSEHYRDMYNAISDATLWKMTKPARAILNVLEQPFKKSTGRGRAAKAASPSLVKRGFSVWKNEGFRVLVYKIRNKKKHKDEYQLWMEQNETNILYAEPLEYNPLISVVVPVYNVAGDMLEACIESVINQTYANWELCLVDDCSTMDSVRKVLKRYEGREKIKIKYRGENGHISRATNDGIAMSSGEFIGLMDCDDLLAPNALYEVARMLNKDESYDFIYSDEDKIDEQGKERRDPFFKPDWSPDTFMSYMYTCHFSVYRKKLVDELGGLRVGYEGSQDYDLVLRIMERTNHIGHIAKILYHWRMRRESTASDITAKPYIIEATVKAKTDALMRRGLKGRLTCIDKITQFRVTYEPQGKPLVSVIIPSKDNGAVLKKCIESIEGITAYKNYEIIIIDNGSSKENMEKYKELAAQYNCTYFYQKKEFNFSYMCNKGASLAKGNLLLFLNDDIEIPEGQEEWMAIMAGQAQLGHTGAVGAKLVYPGTNLIQHVGVLNLPIGPGHAFHRFDDSLNFYWGRNLLDYNFSAVTGACLMVARDKFEKVGGFNEAFPVAYNDVELCFKLLEQGLYNVLRNDVKLVHHESISRGYDETPEKAKRLQTEREQLYGLHPKFKGYDPCYNPNLTPDKGDFSLNVSRVKAKAVAPEKFGNSKCLYTEDGINYKIDIFEKKDNVVKLSGWAYQKGITNCNRTDTYVVLTDTRGDCYRAATMKTYRPDVNAAYGAKGKLSFSGFECVIDLGTLPMGPYIVGIAIGKYCKLTGQEILSHGVKRQAE